MVRIISWNVNGIRAIIKKNFIEDMERENPDILCLQETKAQCDQIDFPLDYPFVYTNSAVKKGYSGVLVASKVEPISVTKGIGIEEHDQEGRVLTLEFEDYYLVNCYTPNAQNKLARIEYRQKWDIAFRDHLKKLEEKKPVVACGDLNVAHEEIDLARPDDNHDNPGFSDQERDGMTKHIEAGFVDTFRHFYPEKEGVYSWWSYRTKARDRNVGWRIDYFIVSESLKTRLKGAGILTEVFGSDHCPVEITLD